MSCSWRSRRSESGDAHSSYQSYLGIEKAQIGISKVVEFDLPRHERVYYMLAEAGILSVIIQDIFSSFLVREFYNHLEDPSYTDLNGGVRSKIQGQYVEITPIDLRSEFGIMESENVLDIVENYRLERDWTLMNMSLHGNSTKNLITTMTTLTDDARLVQDILRHTIMLKSGDTHSITAQLSLVTYYMVENELFDVTDLLLSMIRYTFRLKNPEWKKAHTLPLGAIIQHILFKKYTWIDQSFYVGDCVPDIYQTAGIKSKKNQRKPPTTEMREPHISRGGSMREALDSFQTKLDRHIDDFQEHRRSFEEHKAEVKKDRTRMQKFMKFLVKGLKLKPTPAEAAEWEVPTEEEPRRQSVSRARRKKTVVRRSDYDLPESSGAGSRNEEDSD